MTTPKNIPSQIASVPSGKKEKTYRRRTRARKSENVPSYMSDRLSIL
jgi:hypothetical protein